MCRAGNCWALFRFNLQEAKKNAKLCLLLYGFSILFQFYLSPSTAGDVEKCSISAFFIDYREEIQGDSVLIE